MDRKIEEAIERGYSKLTSNIEELRKELETHEEGDIAKILIESGALSVGELESEAFQFFEYDDISLEDVDVWDKSEDSWETIAEVVYETTDLDNFAVWATSNIESVYLVSDSNKELSNDFSEISIEIKDINNQILVERTGKEEIYYLDYDPELKWAA